MTKLRDILLPSASPGRIELILSKIKEVEDHIGSGENVDQLINEFNKFTGRNYDKYYFENYWRSENLEDFARDAAQPVAKKISDISKEELVEIVNRIINADENSNFYLELLERNLPHPRVRNLIFWPQNEGLTNDPTPGEIVDKAMNYKSI